MPFDSEVLPTSVSRPATLSLAALIDAIDAPEPRWAAARPDRALAFLMVSPRDCALLDVL